MKKQTTKYALTAALIAIWGILGLRIYQKVKAKQLPLTLAPAPVFASDNYQSEPYVLLLDYRDPFLDRQLKSPKKAKPPATARTKAPAKAVNKAPKPIIQFPAVSYNGSLVLKSGRQVALIRLNGQLVNIGLGERHQQLEVAGIFEDSVQLSYQGLQKTILKVRE